MDAAYKGLEHSGTPDLEKGSVVLQEKLESVRKCAVRFVTWNYIYETISTAYILRQLIWEFLNKEENTMDSSTYTKV